MCIIYSYLSIYIYIYIRIMCISVCVSIYFPTSIHLPATSVTPRPLTPPRHPIPCCGPVVAAPRPRRLWRRDADGDRQGGWGSKASAAKWTGTFSWGSNLGDSRILRELEFQTISKPEKKDMKHDWLSWYEPSNKKCFGAVCYCPSPARSLLNR